MSVGKQHRQSRLPILERYVGGHVEADAPVRIVARSFGEGSHFLQRLQAPGGFELLSKEFVGFVESAFEEAPSKVREPGIVIRAKRADQESQAC